MPWRDPQIWYDLKILFLAFTSAISGGAGGALVASAHVLHRRIDTLALAAAHTFVGVCIGFAVFAAQQWIPAVTITEVSDSLLIGFIAGVAGSIGLAGSHVVVRIALKRLGISMELHVRSGNRQWKDRRDFD